MAKLKHLETAVIQNDIHDEVERGLGAEMLATIQIAICFSFLVL
jgi:hypothetical protein